jgi:RNA polymerase sigma factor (sigma-70 family)
VSISMDPSWTESSDAQIIDACLNGNEKAWQALVNRYKRLVYSVPVKWGLSPDDAVDIFQAVWLDCFRQLASLRDLERLQPWLIRVAVRKCHRFSEAKRERAEDSIAEEEMEELPQVEVSPELFEELDQEQLLRSALEKLTPRCRQVISALFFEDPRPSYQLIASRLGLSENSIGFTRERCLNNLKKILAELGFRT